MTEPILPGTDAYERLVVELRAGRLAAAAFVAIIEASVERA